MCGLLSVCDGLVKICLHLAATGRILLLASAPHLLTCHTLQSGLVFFKIILRLIFIPAYLMHTQLNTYTHTFICRNWEKMQNAAAVGRDKQHSVR